MRAPDAAVLCNPDHASIRGARADILERLQRAGSGTVVPVSLEGIELSASCHAALFGPVLEAIVRGSYPGRFVVAVDPGARNEWDADAAMRKYSETVGEKLVCVWDRTDRCVLVGSVDTQVRATYDFVTEIWQRTGEGATARELADMFQLTIQAASNRLTKAAGLGIVYSADVESVMGGGRQNRYVPVQ